MTVPVACGQFTLARARGHSRQISRAPIAPRNRNPPPNIVMMTITKTTDPKVGGGGGALLDDKGVFPMVPASER